MSTAHIIFRTTRLRPIYDRPVSGLFGRIQAHIIDQTVSNINGKMRYCGDRKGENRQRGNLFAK